MFFENAQLSDCTRSDILQNNLIFCFQPSGYQLSIKHAPIAQLDRVTDYESVGRRFESCWAHQ